MILSFYPKPGHVCHWPAAARMTGQIYNYVGRTLDPATRVHVANADPARIDDSPADAEQAVRAARLVELCKRDGSLWPADEATAKACDVSFVPVERIDGEWQPKAPSLKTKPKES